MGLPVSTFLIRSPDGDGFEDVNRIYGGPESLVELDYDH